MSNQLTQAELKQLAKDAGAYMQYDIHRVYSLFFSEAALAKFAQLIQQREGNPVYMVGIAGADNAWSEVDQDTYGKADFMPRRKIVYSTPVDASKLVSQALEKAAEVVRENSWRLTGLSKESEDRNAEAIISEIRALIGQPVETVLDDNVEEIIRTSFKQGFALGSGKGAEYTPLAKSCEDALVGAYLGGGKFNSSPPVDQGGDELVNAVDAALFEFKDLVDHANDLFLEIESEEASQKAGVLATRISGIEKSLRQALANRRSGE